MPRRHHCIHGDASPDIASLTAEIPKFTDDYMDVRLQGWKTTPGMQDDCRDAGGRATPGAVAELE
jgi:hypothetical protein